MATFVSHVQGESAKAWRTNAAGAWQAQTDTLGSLQPQDHASFVFDASGNGLAVWRAADVNQAYAPVIAASRYTKASGKWSTFTPMSGTENQPGVPAVAIDSKGDGMAIWVRNKKLIASRYTQAAGWEDVDALGGDLVVDIVDDAPALVFDGVGYVAAWTALVSGARYNYTARYDLTTGWSNYELVQKAVADGKTVARMPRLGADGRGNVLLVWAKGASPTYTLMWQRYARGSWSAASPVAGGTVTAKLFESDTRLPFSVNASGQAVLAWPNTDANGNITGIRLASFF